jgi:hopanoid biosynthesis associated protein HpnK
MTNEIRAQFAAFRKTGLPLDHVNAHNHLHVHPTVQAIIFRVGREFNMRAVRVPGEASDPAADEKPTFEQAIAKPWIGLLRRKVRREGLLSNDHLMGMRHSGHMTEDRVLQALRNLKDGLTEIYFHPATQRCAALDRDMADYQHEAELQALLSPRVRNAIGEANIQLTTYSDEMPNGTSASSSERESATCSV